MNLLVYSQTNEYRHDSIPAGVALFHRLAREHRFGVEEEHAVRKVELGRRLAQDEPALEAEQLELVGVRRQVPIARCKGPGTGQLTGERDEPDPGRGPWAVGECWGRMSGGRSSRSGGARQRRPTCPGDAYRTRRTPDPECLPRAVA